MIIKGMAVNQKKGEWTKIYKLESHDLISKGSVVDKN